ncbi:hypothetical protein FLTE109939_05495 [Flavobacterium terrigena]|uniref:Uncharacterized protein n=1 Tax=Flavobacterium terrigena TaxID=402734 RepID=A0A1H6SWC3_9FLAO|nr:hypothetical protein SAMN05660918_1428 [Flavobacterium terrigena]
MLNNQHLSVFIIYLTIDVVFVIFFANKNLRLKFIDYLLDKIDIKHLTI